MMRMRQALLSLVAVLTIGGAPFAPAPVLAAAPTDTPVGRWLTRDREAVISIEPCGGTLCGRIVGITLDHPDDPMPVDHLGQPQCGLTIIRYGVQDGDGWMAQIMDPRDGATYRARLHVDDAGRLQVRGYIGIPLLGRTQAWTAFPGEIPADCRLGIP